jgi:hypothetical protein
MVEIITNNGDGDHMRSVRYMRSFQEMDNPSLLTAINKLAISGERAGFSVEKMIQILNAGISMETLLQLIDSNLNLEMNKAGSSRWIM